MENLLDDQARIGKELENLLRNFRKDSSVRKTPEYLEKRIQLVNTHWKTFEANHERLLLLQEADPSENEYFQNEYHDRIQEVYQTLKSLLVECQENVKPTTAPPTVADIPKTAQSDGATTSSALANDCDDEGDKRLRKFILATDYHVSTERTDDDIKRLVRKQKALMRTITHLIQDIESRAGHEFSVPYYDLKIRLLQNYQVELVTNDQLIWENTSDDAPLGYEAALFHELDDWTQDTIVSLQQRLLTLNQSTSAQSQNIKLPKIVLPKFDGEYLKWTQFHDLFTQTVHNQAIGNAQKMWFLKSNLTGEAELLIRHLSVSEENYDTAWEILNQRFNNKRLLATALLDRLVTQQTITSESVSAIKRMHDTTKECLLALNNLGISTTTWDPILLHLLIKRLDKTTHTLYEQGLKAPRELQTMEGFFKFLEQRFQSLETLGKHKNDSKPSGRTSALVSSTTRVQGIICKLCQKGHGLFACPKFLQSSTSERIKTAHHLKVCTNCLKSTHLTSNCPARGCTKCQRKHNTLLHKDQTTDLTTNKAVRLTKAEPETNNTAFKVNAVTLSAEAEKFLRRYVILGTVLIHVLDNKGTTIDCRAILDSGSQLNFITDKLAKKLGLQRCQDSMCIQGIGESKQRSQHRINIQLQSRINGFSARIEAFILPQITTHQPAHELNIKSWSIPRNIELADPRFNFPDRVDLLIGAELYHQLLSVGQIKLGDHLPTLQNTVFGWIVAGATPTVSQQSRICGVSTAEEAKLETQIERFWRLEEVTTQSPRLTAEQQRCEMHFAHTVRRDDTGRFVVKLPFLLEADKLGESKDIAFRRFISTERKLMRNPELGIQYKKFMKDYMDLGHMREIDFNKIRGPHYFLPHHAVLKPDSTTTKLRVVFDGSCKTSTNISLNEILCTGPTIQDDLFSILIRFRMPRFAFTADIEKMYRQIMVDPADRRYQLIWWRDEPTQSVKCFELCTVTYGTTSAPYLATKCLQQLARETGTKYPVGAATIKNDFYVDDLMTGSNSLVEAIETQKQLQGALQTAGFKLRKWCANHPQLLQYIPKQDKALQLDIHDVEDSIKTLGLTWTPKTDEFCINTSYTEQTRVTKRTVLSEIAHLFDPLGILSPVITLAKIFLQKLWRLKLDWDTALPMELHSTWLQFRQGLKTLADIKIPRHVFAGRIPQSIQLHAFADASEKAYGAVTYLRAINTDGVITVRLLCAKSKVAPVKPITLPRLELCAAKLAVELVSRLKIDLKLEDISCYYWTDSEVTLSWINSEAASFHTFVAHRIAYIQESSLAEQWRHVASKQNPADIVSRGVAPEKLASCSIWFYGPIFLHGSESTWPPIYSKKNIDLEKKHPRVSLAAADEATHLMHLIDHQNNFLRWQRIIAYTLRFIRNCRTASNSRRKGHLSVNELEEALMVMIQTIQGEEFSEDLRQLQRTGQVDNSSCTLTPFIDQRGVIRVGGRLEASNLSPDAKHPILIPYNHIFTRLLMTRIHLHNLHCGPQALLATTRQNYWPIKGKTTARSIVGNCIRCTRTKPKLLSQFMGNLPTHRVQPARPFVNAGVDFLGPVWIHYKLRGKRPQKAYIAVFCCFATKAIHFEVASDLGTTAFIGCLRRFVGRRGHCRHLYSDNATNFVGAKNQLSELQDTLHSEKARQKIATYCTPKGIEFHFIPPRAPHFGGLWEAAVKSAKHFLQRNLASASLTYEELETLMVDIEAILNSRPLTPLSADPNDLSALTPGHFLIGEPLTTIVDPSAQPARATPLQRWKLVSHLKNQFWQRWSKEYLSELQHRYKWKQQSENARPGMLVVIKEDNLPATSWTLGRIIQTIKGHDGLVRVADVKTSSGILRRPIHKLAPLPIEEANNSIANNSTAEIPSSKTPSTKSNLDLPDALSDVGSKRKASTEPQSSSLASTSEATRPSKRKHHSRSTASLLLLTCFILPILGQVSIKPFQSRPGLYFETIGNAHLTSNDWNLVVYYNLSTLWQEYDAIISGIRNLTNLCNVTIDKETCEPTLKQFQSILIELQDGNELLLHQNKNTRSRMKRAPLNFIGNIASSLFGVLDAEYAEKMVQVIENLKDNDDHILELIKNQTSIIDSTVNIIKQSQAAIDSRFEDFNQYLNLTVVKLNNMTHEMQQQKISQMFSVLSLQLVLAINGYQRTQSNLWDVFIDSHHGKINPYLLSPSQLSSQLVHVQDHLPSSLRLPAKPDDLIKLYNLMTVEGRITPNQMIFRLKLPLFTPERFELLRIISVPFVTNGTLMLIKSSTDFLIINLHRDQYYPLSETELRDCITSEAGFICKQHHPLYTKESNRSACEISLITQSTPRYCQIILAPSNSRWMQLTNLNQWIYTTTRPTTINIVCGSSVTQENLNGSGILEIGSQCIIKDETTTIRGHNIISSVLTARFLTSNFTDLLYSPSVQEVLYRTKPTQNLTNEIQGLQQQINNLQHNEKLLPKGLTPHDTHQFAVGYTCLLLLLLISGYIGSRYIASKRLTSTTSPEPPVPLPRRRPPNDSRFQIDPELLSESSTRGGCLDQAK